jgi:hypothetical protein
MIFILVGGTKGSRKRTAPLPASQENKYGKGSDIRCREVS